MAVVLCVRPRTLGAIINFNSRTYLQLTESSSITQTCCSKDNVFHFRTKFVQTMSVWHLDNCFRSAYREARHDVGCRLTSFAMPTLCHTYISNKGNTRDMQYAVHRFIPSCDRTCIMCLFAPFLSSRLWSAPANRQRNMEEGDYLKYKRDFMHLYSYYKEAYIKISQ
jgi:hypothetical protein